MEEGFFETQVPGIGGSKLKSSKGSKWQD